MVETIKTIKINSEDNVAVAITDLKKGEKVLYRPRSFDGGHQYTLKIVRFF